MRISLSSPLHPPPSLSIRSVVAGATGTGCVRDRCVYTCAREEKDGEREREERRKGGRGGGREKTYHAIGHLKPNAGKVDVRNHKFRHAFSIVSCLFGGVGGEGRGVGREGGGEGEVRCISYNTHTYARTRTRTRTRTRAHTKALATTTTITTLLQLLLHTHNAPPPCASCEGA